MANDTYVYRLIQWSAVAVFVGRGWQHIYWDAPYRELLWDEASLKWLVEGVWGMEWRAYVASPAVDRAIQGIIIGTGYFYWLCAVAALLVQKWPRPARLLLWLGSANLVLLAALYYKEQFLFAGQFFEYALQCGAPVFLILLSRNQAPLLSPRLVLAMKIAIALTFSCHGLYALGYYPRPGSFMEMTINILPLGEAGARSFLIAAGILDIVLSILLFLPGWPGRWALGYAVLWGLATALARFFAYFHWHYADSWVLQWLHELLIRLPHFLIPLALLLYLWPRLRSTPVK